MGNCSFKSDAISDAKESNSIRIMTDSGDILEFAAPKFAGKLLGNFPGYGIFRQGRISSPVPENEELRSDQLYFLLPLGGSKLAENDKHHDPTSLSDVSNPTPTCIQTVSESNQNTKDYKNLSKESSSEADAVWVSCNLNDACKQTSSESTQKGENFATMNKECSKEANPEPIRMSTSVEVLPRMSSSVEVLPPPQKGVWRVKLLIDTKQLEEILSEEVNTEAMIEQMRLAASTAIPTPRRTKFSWEQWRASWKPMLTSVFKNSVDQRSKIQSPAA